MSRLEMFITSPGLIIARVYLVTFKNSLRKLWPLSLREWAIALFLVGYLVGGFEIFFLAFRFVRSFPVVGDLLLDRLWHFYFFILWIMLIFSNAVIAYLCQYKTQETSFLFGLPMSSRFIFYKQLFEGAALSSWGFLFLSLPLMIAFGLVLKSPFMYYLAAPFFLIPFVFLAAILGSGLTFCILKLNRRKKNLVLTITFTGLFILMFVYLLRFPSELRGETESQVLGFLKKFLEGLSFSRSLVIPSTWFSKGFIEMAQSHFKDGIFFLALLMSAALVLGDLAYFFSGALYPRAWEKAQGVRALHQQTLFSKMIQKLKLSAFVRKDILCLVRDPSQWVQGVVLGAMMILYTTNLRNIQAYIEHPYWENMIFFMNLAAISLMIATLSLRFVFPQFSLEWRRDWILGLVPMEFTNFLKVKFYIPLLIFLVLGQLMSWLSNFILGSSLLQQFLSSLILSFVCVGLVGLSLGLGILYPTFKTDNPSRIMSSLGGILALVFSMAYCLVMLIPLSLPFHWIAMGRLAPSYLSFAWIGLGMIFDAVISIGIAYSILKIARDHCVSGKIFNSFLLR